VNTKVNHQMHTPSIEDQFGKRVANLLDAQSQQLDGNLQDRLLQSRTLAMSRVKQEPNFILDRQMAGAGHHFDAPRFGNPMWSFATWLIPLAVVVLGLIAIVEWQEDLRIKDIATVDIALLTDDVPPSAFADNGYMAYLKMKTLAKPEPEEQKAENDKI